MSGEAALNQVRAASMRALMPLTFQVAIFMAHTTCHARLEPGIQYYGQARLANCG